MAGVAMVLAAVTLAAAAAEPQDTGNKPPVPVPTYVAACGLRLHFDGSGSSDDDGMVAAWAWDFDDGAAAQGMAVDHDFPAVGKYVVRLTVRDDVGAAATRALGLHVEPCLPLRLTAQDASVSPGETVRLCPLASGGKGSYAYSVADLPDGATFLEGCLKWQPQSAGKFCVPVTASDGRDSVTACLNVQVTAKDGGAPGKKAETPLPPASDPAPLPDVAGKAVPATPAATVEPGTQAPATAAKPDLLAWWPLLLLLVPAAALAVHLRRRADRQGPA
ncbi:MAG: PKD domain-containing protein [Halobacteriales archaeon]|nr:PKD domain-containing protein [Halobacteriales archaeon]